MTDNSSTAPILKSASEGLSTQISFEANRLAGLRIGSDISTGVSLSGDASRIDSKNVRQPATSSTGIKESGVSLPMAQQRYSMSSGWAKDAVTPKSSMAPEVPRPPPRIDLQRCDGSNIVNWLRMVDLHLSNLHYSEEQWMSEVPYYLEGGALALWWEVHERNTGDQTVTWTSFKQELMDRFCPRSEIEVISNLRQVKYKDDIRFYIQKFSETVMQGRRPAEDVLLKLFLFGLPPDYFMALTEGGLKSFATLSEAMSKAKDMFAPKEAAAAEYIERNPDRVHQLNRSSADPVFMRTLLKLGISGSNNDKSRERYQERNNRGEDACDQQQRQMRRFNNSRQPVRYQQRIFDERNTNRANKEQYVQRNRDIGKLICKTCNGKGHEEQHCPLLVEGNRRPGQTCRRCGGKEHWTNQCTTPRWFRQTGSKPQIHCAIGENIDHECRENGDA